MNHTPVLDVPIVGQSIKALGYTLLVLADCTCTPGVPFQVIVQLQNGQTQALRSACPRCQNLYSVNAMKTNDSGVLSAFAFAVEKPVQA